MSNEAWTTLVGVPAGTSVLAFVTTVHCALMLLRRYRPNGNRILLLIPSFAFVASPWFLATPVWLGTIFLTHVAWFIACERLVPPAVQTKPASTATRPAARTQAAGPVVKRPAGFTPVPVLATFSETADIRTFRLARPEGFAFRAGQFLMVRVELDGKPVIRCYSICSSPSTRGYLEISVRKQGPVSALLHETVAAGSTLSVRGPGGAFVYPEGREPLVLIAGGIGITPVISMLRHALECDPQRAVVLLLSARTASQVPFAPDLQLLADRHPQMRLAITLSGGSTDPRFFSGRIDANLLAATVENLRQAVFMICGPLPLIEATHQTLLSLGVPERQIHFEKFEAAVSAATAAVTGERLSIRMAQRGVEFHAAPGQSILEAAEAAGESIEFMCRVGVCGTCRLRVTEGEVEGDFEALDSADRAAGYVLACVAKPATNCILEV